MAIVATILAALVQSRLHGLLPSAPPQIAEAAQRLAMGDMPQALQLLPLASHALLVQGYGDAFHILLYILAGIALLSAAMVFGFLSQPHLPAADCLVDTLNADEAEIA